MILERTVQFKGYSGRLYPIIQGGMGAGVSLADLASACREAGIVGTISSVALDQLTPFRIKIDQKVFAAEAKARGIDPLVYATMREITDSRGTQGTFQDDFVAINIMRALFNSWDLSIEGAVRGGANMIISGAGLPTKLPEEVNAIIERYHDELPNGILSSEGHNINLVPIVSSSVALELVCRAWKKQGYVPDAVVLEGPKAGGHLGFFYKEMPDNEKDFLEKYDLFKVLLNPVLEVAKRFGRDGKPIPVFVAGGIYSHQDIVNALGIEGVAGVQMGTRFAATTESGASAEFKQAYIETREEDIYILRNGNGSPCGFPFRVTRKSPLNPSTRQGDMCICTALVAATELKKENTGSNCPERYVLNPKKGACTAAGNNTYTPIFTCGTNAYRVTEIVPVQKLVDELIGK